MHNWTDEHLNESAVKYGLSHGRYISESNQDDYNSFLDHMEQRMGRFFEKYYAGFMEGLMSKK